jgi:hypothetical protein
LPTVSYPRFSWQSATMRALIGVFGGFAFALCFMVGMASSMAAAGWLSRADAAVAAGMLAFLVWMSSVLTSFAAASAWRAAAWLAAPACAFALLAWWCLHA